MQTPELSLVVPAYNEAPSLRELAAEIADVCGSLGRPWEVVMVDDGSTDGSAAAIRALAAEDPRVRGVFLATNQGKAAALTAGFAAAQGRIVVTLDADLQDDPHDLPRLLAKIDEGLDLACGWKKPRRDSWGRRASSRVFNLLTSSFLGPRLHDHNCGFKAYRRAVIEEISLYGDLHRFATFLAHARGFRVGEVPINHRPRRYGGSRYGMKRLWSGSLDLVTASLIARGTRRVFGFFAGAGVPLAAAGLILCLLLLLPAASDATFRRVPLFLAGILSFLVGVQMLAAGLLCELILSLWRRRHGRPPGDRFVLFPAGTDADEATIREAAETAKGLVIGPSRRSCSCPAAIVEDFPGSPRSAEELAVWCECRGHAVVQIDSSAARRPARAGFLAKLRHLPLYFVARYHARPLHFFGTCGALLVLAGLATGLSVKLSSMGGQLRYFLMELALGFAVAGVELFVAGLLGELLASVRNTLGAVAPPRQQGDN